MTVILNNSWNTVVLDYCEVMETYSRIELLRSHGNLQSYWTTAKSRKPTVVLDYCEVMETYSRIGLLRSHGNLQSYWTTKKLWTLTNTIFRWRIFFFQKCLFFRHEYSTTRMWVRRYQTVPGGAANSGWWGYEQWLVRLRTVPGGATNSAWWGCEQCLVRLRTVPGETANSGWWGYEQCPVKKLYL